MGLYLALVTNAGLLEIPLRLPAIINAYYQEYISIMNFNADIFAWRRSVIEVGIGIHVRAGI